MSKARLIAVLIGLCAMTAATIGPAEAAVTPAVRVDLRVLVLSDGQAPVAAIQRQLEIEGVPNDVVDLTNAGRPEVTSAFLSDTVNGVARAKFQAVVVPQEQSSLLSAAELAAIAGFQSAFGIRSVSAYNWANPAIGLQYAGYSGPLDGQVGAVTDAGKSAGWGYLNGPVSFEDNDPAVSESWAYLAAPLTQPADGTSFTPIITAEVAGNTGVLAGVLTSGGRENLELTFAYNSNQRQFQAIGHGIVTWMTKGVHLGYNRNYFSVHVDDVLNADARWDAAANCTPGEDCPAGSGAESDSILMTPQDVATLTAWQTANAFKLQMVYNAGPSVARIAANGSDPLTDAFKADKSQFTWVNHTYTHPYLGCVQDHSVVPWTCQRDANGAVVWTSKATIIDEIRKNRAWAQANGITQANSELVTGEHSGLKSLPQMPDDNPNLASALTNTGIKYVASDSSRESGSRTIGSASTLPRYPMNVYYNTASESDMTDEFNWLYNSAADGGSGICENSQVSTCIAPLPISSGYRDYIVPTEVAIDLRHILGNDVRPHYAHQSNLAGDRILLTVVERILAEYRSIFAANTPVVNTTMTQATTVLRNQAGWTSAMSSVSAYVQGGKVTIVAPTAGVNVPMTMPAGTKRGTGTFGAAYGGENSEWRVVKGTMTLTLAGTPFAPVAAAPLAVQGAAPTPSIPPAVTSDATTPELGLAPSAGADAPR